jgi:hypothetical protein
MKVETRLEQLEHEFKVLKSEIQATLLEIQEQILNHYYPALRADEETVTPANPAKPEPPKLNGQRPRSTVDVNGNDDHRTNGFGANGFIANGFGMTGQGENGNGSAGLGLPGAGANGHVFPFKDALDDLSDDEMDDGVGPSLREVSIAELKRGPEASKNRSVTIKPEPSATPMNFVHLADWVAESTRTLGCERTLKVVETYAATGNLAAAHKTMIVQLIELAGEDGPEQAPPSTAAMQALLKLDQLLRGA